MVKVQGYKFLSIFTIFLLCLSIVVTPLQSIAYAEEEQVHKEDDFSEQESDAVQEDPEQEDDDSNLSPVKKDVNELATEENGNESGLNKDADSSDEREEETGQEGDDVVVDYSDFEVNIDEFSTTKNSITINWSVNYDIVEEFRLYLEGENGSYDVTTVSSDTNSYTFEKLNTREEYFIEIEAKSVEKDYINYYAYASDWYIPDWSEEELVPVSLVTIFNADPWYNERIRIRGLEENNKAYDADEYIGYTDDLYLPLGKYEVTVYNEEDPSISIAETFEVKEGIDYLNNPIQLKLRLKEAHEAAEPFKFDVTKVTEDSFTLAWNNVSKITGFEIIARNWDGSYHESKSGLIENNISEFTLERLNSNLIYSINFISNYLHDLNKTHYFNVKTKGEDAEAPKVEFENDALHEIIAKDLGVYLRDVTEADMEDLTSLYIDYDQITSLEGIQYAHNLESFSSYGNQISDITRLENLLQLYDLSLGNSNITDISALANLTDLRYLYLYNNKISDISALKDLTSIDQLDLDSNEIENIEVLANLTKLSYLHLNYNNISDISALKDLTELYTLNLSSNEITNVEALANLTELNYLSLYNNNISDISALKNLTNLYSLDLNLNEVTSVEALSNLSELNDLYLSNNNIADISSLKNLNQLNNLNLGSNEITDISPLANLSELEYLNLDYNNITDITDLIGLASLEELSLDGNDIADISVLKELPRLQYVYLYDIEITEAHMETIQYLRNDGVEVYFYYYDDEDWNDWEDEDGDSDDEDIIIDREEVLKEFPEDQGFIVSEDGKTIELDLSKKGKEKVELTSEQTRMLIENNQTLDVQREGVHTSIPASSFDKYNDEPVTVEINEVENDPNSLSSTYDFTIKQGTRTISQFDEGITLTFNVNASRAKNPRNLKVFYFNEETNLWENIGGTYHSNGTVTVVTAHFSKFTVFEAEDEESDEIVDLKDNTPNDEESEDKNPPKVEDPNDKGSKDEKENNEKPIDNKNTNDDQEIIVENTTDKETNNVKTEVESNQSETKITNDDDKSNELPSTATNLYNLLAVGLLLILTGATVYLINRRRAQVK